MPTVQRLDNSAAAVDSAPNVMKTVLKSGRHNEYDVVVPSAATTIREIQQQIPVEFFERNTARSAMFLLRDVAQVAATYAFMYAVALPFVELIESMSTAVPVGRLLRCLLWCVFWFVQGLNGTALWVLAHECGHQAFSPLRSVNDAVGMLLHSALLVPYHSWRITHGTHHKHTNHLTKDLVFVPKKRISATMDVAEDAPLVSLGRLLVMFLFGWPAHLLANASGQNFGRHASHFDPTAPFFRSEDYHDVVMSDVGVVTVLLVVLSCVYRFGFASVFCWYIAPYLWVNFWLVFITYMQHTDMRLPHYTHEHWTFVRGAVAAVDRDYGALLNAWLHHINDSHVVHHMFSKMPHYNAIQVTRRHIRGILGESYVTDAQPLLKALWTVARNCHYVIPTDGICVFHR